MIFRTALIAVLLTSVYSYVHVQAPIPILASPPGWSLSYQNGTAATPHPSAIVVEVMLDLVCPDSNLTWHVMKRLREEYEPKDLTVVIHMYALPYHRNAYILKQGFHLILESHPEKASDYVDLVFEHYDYFKGSATTEMTDTQVTKFLSGLVEQLGIDSTMFKAGVGNYKSIVTKTWKHAARRGVAGTPWFFVNGIDLAGD